MGTANSSLKLPADPKIPGFIKLNWANTVSYTHLRAHETVLDLVCRLLLEKKKQYSYKPDIPIYKHRKHIT